MIILAIFVTLQTHYKKPHYLFPGLFSLDGVDLFRGKPLLVRREPAGPWRSDKSEQHKASKLENKGRLGRDMYIWSLRLATYTV